MVVGVGGNYPVQTSSRVTHCDMATDTPLAHFWPLFGLRIETPRLQLRLGRDDDFPEALALINDGIHDPSVMPFDAPWTDGPPDRRARGALQHWWLTRANVEPESWMLNFFVYAEGALIGSQGIVGSNFLTLREATTGSWLGRRFQGQGYGIEMRAAVLHFGFEMLDANAMLSAAFADNEASRRVSTKLGYEFDGIVTKAPRGEPIESHRFRLTRDRWLAHRRPLDVNVVGFDTCRPMLGL
jgi:RimJ/RimL family protein N-acetyltransferase